MDQSLCRGLQVSSTAEKESRWELRTCEARGACKGSARDETVCDVGGYGVLAQRGHGRASHCSQQINYALHRLSPCVFRRHGASLPNICSRY